MISKSEKRPNIVIVIPTLKGAGAERVMLTLATSLRDQGCLVSIVVFNNVRELESEFDNIYHFNRYFRWIPRKLRGYFLAPILDHFIVSKCGTPDLVLSNLLIADRIVSHSKLNKHIIIHSTVSSEIKYLNASFNEYKELYIGQSLVCVSKGAMTDFAEVFPQQPPEKLNHIYNPVDQAHIKNAANADIKAPVDEYIVHVGSFSSPKRHDLLIKAYVASGVQESLVLVGKGKLENELKDLVADLGVEDKVIFAGFQANPYPLIKNAKLLVLSSDYEGLSMVILEAISLGVPAVSTNCKSGPSEILPPKNLCATDDLDGLTELMKQALISPVDYIVPLADEFTPAHACGQYLKLIKSLD